MAYNKKYATLGESVIDYVNNREDAIEQGFSDVDTDINGVSQALQDLLQQFNSIADYPIDEGLGYTKWNSGKLEAFGTKSVTIGTDQVVSLDLPTGLSFIGALYDTNILLTVNRAGGFDRINAQAKGRVEGGRGFNVYVYVEEGTISPTSATVSYHCIGRWK